MKRSIIYRALLLAMFCAAAIEGIAQQTDATTTTVTNATGTISQLNYGSDGEVAGFLVSTNILLLFPAQICGGLSGLGAVGNSIAYSGTSVTTSSGFQTVVVTSFTNDTTKATYTAPTSNSSTAYSPTSGTVKQLNYANGGAIDGFLFTPSGSASAIFVTTGPYGTASLSTLLTVGATVSVTGTTSPSMGACSATSAIEVVNASSLTIGSQTVVFAGGGYGGGGRGFGGGPGGHH